MSDIEAGMRYSVCIMLQPFCSAANRKETASTPAGDSRASHTTLTAVKPRPPATASVSWRSGPATCSMPARPQMPAERNIVRRMTRLTGMPA